MTRTDSSEASARGRGGLARWAALVAVAALGCAASSPGASGAGPTAEGAQLYREHCGSCHRLRAPSEETRDRWAWAVDRFGARAHLSPGERQLVLAYLQSHAKDAGAASPEAR
jgi:mono/diheme cytochrome c family protein